MTHMLLLGIGFILLLMMFYAGILLRRDIRLEERFGERVRAIHGQGPTPSEASEPIALREMVTQLLGQLGQFMLNSGLIPARTRSELENMLTTAGLRGPQGVGVFIACKILLLAFLPLIAWLVTRDRAMPDMVHTIIPPIAGVLGLLAPDWLMGKLRERYLDRLEKGLPDALDMMVICAQAGLGLGPIVVRVAEELEESYRELAMEMALTAHDLRVMADSRIALSNLGTRTGLEGFKRLSTTLIQTIQYGTPMTEALRTLSAELRLEMLTKFEAKAARLPVMLTLPTIVFILPCVFLIAGGPAMIQVMKVFSN